MLEPTEALREILRRHKAKGIFFVDTLSLMRFEKEQELRGELDAVKKQLIQLNSEGHYIFPHIHAHWLDSKYIPAQKQFNLSNLQKYSLSNLDKLKVQDLFSQSISFLKHTGIDYPEWGYRAGGWCMQPFSLYQDIFTGQNIRYDFSVLPGYRNDNPSQAFDYTSVHLNTPYHFSTAIEIPDANGEFIELPISTISLNAFVKFKDRLARKYLWHTGDKGWGDGMSAQTGALKSPQASEMISLDVLNRAKLNTYSAYLKHHSFMHWISHPKMFTRHGLKTFDMFIRKCEANYKTEYDFKKMLPSEN
ncbi:MAG: hypothetical protein ACXVC7_06525 [Bacteroidia bacterium]